jgi:hypothetical protein
MVNGIVTIYRVAMSLSIGHASNWFSSKGEVPHQIEQ